MSPLLLLNNAAIINSGIIDTRMRHSSFGDAVGAYPKPEQWATAAVPFLTSLGLRHNGQSLTVPGQ